MRHRLQIGLGRTGQPTHHLGHRSAGDAVLGVVALSQVLQHRGLGPAQWRSAQRAQRRRLPTVDQRTGQVGPAGAFTAQGVTRRVAGAAVAQAIDEFGAALPLRAARHGQRDRAGLQVDRVPQTHQRSPVERPNQPGLGHAGRDRRA